MTLKQCTEETDIAMGVPKRDMYVTLYRQSSSEHFIVWVLLMYPFALVTSTNLDCYCQLHEHVPTVDRIIYTTNCYLVLPKKLKFVS